MRTTNLKQKTLNSPRLLFC